MRKLFTFLFTALCAVSVLAHDFSADDNGKTFYYNITSSTAPYTVAVTYRGTTYNDGNAAYSGYVSIPSSVTYNNITYAVTSIGNYAFFGDDHISYVTIPNSVTSIGEWTFTSCRGLSNMTIPNSVTSIGEYAFYSCQNLSRITIPNSVTSIGKSAFSLSGLTSVTLPNSLTNIAEETFAWCYSLTSIIIPNSVTNIERRSFYMCTALTSVTIGNSVTNIGYSAFEGCTNLMTVTNHSSLRITSGSRENGYVGYYANHVYVELKVVSEDTQKGTVSGSGVVDAGTTHQIKATPAQNHIFISWNDGYTSATRNVTVFNDVTYTATFAVPSHTYYGITYQALSTTNNTAAVVSATATGAVSIYTQVTLNDNKAYNVVSIQPNVFAGQNVTSITLPSTLTSIGANAFLNCTNLKTVNNRSSLPITAGSADYGYVGYYADHVYIKLEVTSENIAKGIVTGNGNFDAGSTQLIQALPAMGYKFSRWSDGDLNATRFITAINDAQFTAYFAVDPISACAQVEETTVRVIGKEIVSEQPFHVYTLTGINVTAQNGYLPTGLYVVQTLDQCVKIFIP